MILRNSSVIFFFSVLATLYYFYFGFLFYNQDTKNIFAAIFTFVFVYRLKELLNQDREYNSIRLVQSFFTSNIAIIVFSYLGSNIFYIIARYFLKF